MSLHTEKNFYILKAGHFQNKNKLNVAGRILYNFFFLYLNSNPSLTFANEIKNIYITSQYRFGPNTRHVTDKAIDFTIEPIYLMPVFWIILHQYLNLNIFLSIRPENWHIHLDGTFTGLKPITRNFKNRKYLEINHPSKKGWIKMVTPEYKYLTDILKHYKCSQQSIIQFITLYYSQLVSENKKNYLTPSAKGNIIYEETKKAADEILQDLKNMPSTIQDTFNFIAACFGTYLIIDLISN